MNKIAEGLIGRPVEEIYGLLADVKEGKINDEDTLFALLEIIYKELINRLEYNKGFYFSHFEYKVLSFLIYYEADYYKEFCIALDKSFEETNEERKLIDFFHSTLKKMDRRKIFDADALYLIYPSLISMRKLQERRKIYIDQNVDAMESSKALINYIPARNINLDDRELLNCLKESVRVLKTGIIE